MTVIYLDLSKISDSKFTLEKDYRYSTLLTVELSIDTTVSRKWNSSRRIKVNIVHLQYVLDQLDYKSKPVHQINYVTIVLLIETITTVQCTYVFVTSCRIYRFNPAVNFVFTLTVIITFIIVITYQHQVL